MFIYITLLIIILLNILLIVITYITTPRWNYPAGGNNVHNNNIYSVSNTFWYYIFHEQTHLRAVRHYEFPVFPSLRNCIYNILWRIPPHCCSKNSVTTYHYNTVTWTILISFNVTIELWSIHKPPQSIGQKCIYVW